MVDRKLTAETVIEMVTMTFKNREAYTLYRVMREVEALLVGTGLLTPDALHEYKAEREAPETLNEDLSCPFCGEDRIAVDDSESGTDEPWNAWCLQRARNEDRY